MYTRNQFDVLVKSVEILQEENDTLVEENNDLRELLEAVKDGSLAIDDAILQIKRQPFEDIGFAKVDLHRKMRHTARASPLKGPCLRMASMAYWLHVGVKRHVGGFSGEIYFW